MRGEQPARAAAREFLSDIEDGVGYAPLQSFLVLFLNGAMPGEHLVVVDGLTELPNGGPLEEEEHTQRSPRL